MYWYPFQNHACHRAFLQTQPGISSRIPITHIHSKAFIVQTGSSPNANRHRFKKRLPLSPQDSARKLFPSWRKTSGYTGNGSRPGKYPVSDTRFPNVWHRQNDKPAPPFPPNLPRTGCHTPPRSAGTAPWPSPESPSRRKSRADRFSTPRRAGIPTRKSASPAPDQDSRSIATPPPAATPNPAPEAARRSFPEPPAATIRSAT